MVLAALLIAALPGEVPTSLTDAEVAACAEAEFRRGVELRADGGKARPHLAAAVADFDELRRRGASNPELYRNLGNAYLLADDLPHALLSYQRGLRLAPADADLQAGLTEARGRVAYPTSGGFGRPAVSTRPPWLPNVGGGWLLGTAAVCYIAAWVCLTRWLMTRRGRLLAGGAAGFTAAAGLTLLLVVVGRSSEVERERPLVVVAADGVLLRKGDGLAFPPRYETPLNQGVEARRLYQRGDWLQIELSGGEIGWAQRADLLVDEP